MIMLFSLENLTILPYIIDILIIVFIILCICSGYKKGFLESSISFCGFVLSLFVAYILKNKISVFLYTYLPFFNFYGLFKGVSILNIIIYEIIAFIGIFILLMIILKIINKITGLVSKLFSLIVLIGLPNKILGGFIGFVKSIVILYFVIFFLKIGFTFSGYSFDSSIADTIIDFPILKETFGDTLYSLDEIFNLAKEYEYTKDKKEFSDKSINILLKYNVITKDNLDILINDEKIIIYGNIVEEE